MKTLKIICALTALPFIISGCFSHRSAQVKAQERAGGGDSAFSAREEVRKTFQLPADAHVEIRAINGSVDITTGEGNTAEVVVLRLAKNKETFETRKYELALDGNTLSIAGTAGRKQSGVWDILSGGDDIRTKLTIRMPRDVSLSIFNVHGPVNVGEFNGPLEARGINGKLHAAKLSGDIDVSNVNGAFEGEVAKLAKGGVRIHGVNGDVVLAFRGPVDADIDAFGVNGSISARFPNLTVLDEKRGRYRAKAGAGGARIEIGRLNGTLKMGIASGASNAAAVATATPAARSGS